MPGTREKIRAAALELFVRRGYAGTTIADIERAAGLAPRAGGFYRHFASKEDLAVEIGETSIIETSQELGFGGLLPLGDTRAELLVIARGYLRAHERQAPLTGLIHEIQHLPKIRALEARVNAELLELMGEWLATKPYAREMDEIARGALILSIFGGWIFYLHSRGSSDLELSQERMLEEWAALWAGVLDAGV